MRNKFLGAVLLLSSFITTAQTYENATFDDDVATVILQKDIDIYDPLPIISLNSAEKLILSFDMLQPANEFFNYSITHCDRNWNKSDLQEMEYLEGNNMGEISDFFFSTNTYQKYTHYTLTFPQSNMKITKSGNYILKVFRNFDSEDLVLTRRFMVLDEQTTTSIRVNSATLPEKRFTHQEVDFTVDYEGYEIPNPFLDVSATILQNNSWLNSVTNLKPLFVNGNNLSFNYEDKNTFPGTNEFRFFDIRSLRLFSNNVVKKYTDSLQNGVLRPEETKAHLNYLRWLDYNGKRVIFNDDGVNIVNDGDYALMHFWLKANDLSEQGEVYVYGELSDWQLKDDFKMTYFPKLKMYGVSVLLKQSYYSYHFVVKDKEGNIDYTFTEGNHQETENDYTVLIYHKNVFYGYDELIGLAQKNSNTVIEKR